MLQANDGIADVEGIDGETFPMNTSPSILLLDDGELDDVRELLDELQADYLHLRGGEIPDRVEPPEKLFIATSRRAMVASRWPRSGGEQPRPYKIGVVSEDSNTLRSMLRRIGFDLLIRRPVHPYALRLLVLRALYRGVERRRESRVAVGYGISYRNGVRRKRAILVELTMRGGRLISDHTIAVGSRLSLSLPPEVTGNRSLQLRAKVVRSLPDDEGAQPGQHAVGLRFEGMDGRKNRQLAGILKQREGGPAVLPKDMAKASGAVTKAASLPAARAAESMPSAGAGSMEDRRKNPRGTYERLVRSLDEEANLVLMGRDLSVTGMRTEPHRDLLVGDRFRLAIYGAPREEPFVVRARVVRNDGEDGIGLRFEQIASGVAARLESLVATLPSVESLHGDEADALGSVVSRILEREEPEEGETEAGSS